MKSQYSPLYSIIRFYTDSRPAEVIETGLTLEEAQKQCAAPDPDPCGDGWFDGYRSE